jgi:hypothetical protein
MSVRATRNLGALCLLSLGGCAPESIVIAYGPDGSLDAGALDAGNVEEAGPPADAGSRDASGFDRPCTSDADCRNGFFCEKPSCGELLGQCLERPTVCSAFQDPVCGCDGISYFNDCVRQMNGALRAGHSECKEMARRCNPFVGMDCPAGTYCALLQQMGSCDPSTFPVPKCWGLPFDCSSSGKGSYQSCAPIGGSGTGERPCVNLCQAIESELPHAASRACRDRPTTGP